jgi:hypothetical protein
MNKSLGLGFGLVRADTCRPNSLNQAKLVTAIAAMLALSTTCADAAKRHVGKAPRFAAHDVKVVPIHAAPEPSYWMYRLSRCARRGSVYRLFSFQHRAAVPWARSGHQRPLRVAAQLSP